MAHKRYKTRPVSGFRPGVAFGIEMKPSQLVGQAASALASISQSLNDYSLIYQINRDMKILQPQIDRIMPSAQIKESTSSASGPVIRSANISGVCIITIYDDIQTEIGFYKKYQATRILGSDTSLEFAADRYRWALDGPNTAPVESGWTRHYIFWWVTP